MWQQPKVSPRQSGRDETWAIVPDTANALTLLKNLDCVSLPEQLPSCNKASRACAYNGLRTLAPRVLTGYGIWFYTLRAL